MAQPLWMCIGRDDGSTLCLQKLARQVREVAGTAGVHRFDLVGHSLGAAIAIELAATSPDLVRSLIVVAGFSWAPSRGSSFNSSCGSTAPDQPRRVSQAALALRTHADVRFYGRNFGNRRHDQSVYASSQLAGDCAPGRARSGCRYPQTSQWRYKSRSRHQLCSRSDRHADLRIDSENSRFDIPANQCRAPGILRGS
jgi:pimeloyl-ACP methyl ester carboxylesterase